MAFTLPDFNLSANLWTRGVNVLNPPRVVTPCFLTIGRRVVSGTDSQTFSGATSGVGIDMLYRNMGCPARTDIRGSWFPGGGDTVEVPAGSSMFYTAQDVADVARGHPNEYRFAWLIFTSILPPFPVPMP